MVGLLLALAFLAHDLGMVGLAPGSELRLVPDAGSPVNARVVHVTVVKDRHTTQAITQHQHWPEEDAPAPSGCEIALTAVPTADETSAAIRQASLNQIEPAIPWRGASLLSCAADVAVLSPGDQRAFFQVFLI
jgi:hypothetical protein